MKNKKTTNENYLEKVPVIKQGLKWSESDGKVTLEKENTGIANRIAQKLLKKPRVSYIHLDETGSFIWLQIDGEKDIIAIGEAVKAQLGEKAEPLYERLAQYIKTLEHYGFTEFVEKEENA